MTGLFFLPFGAFADSIFFDAFADQKGCFPFGKRDFVLPLRIDVLVWPGWDPAWCFLHTKKDGWFPARLFRCNISCILNYVCFFVDGHASCLGSYQST